MKLRNVFSLIGNLISFVVVGLLIGAIYLNYPNFNPINLGIELRLMSLCLFGLIAFVGLILDIVALARRKLIKSNVYLSLRLLSITLLTSSLALMLFQYTSVLEAINIFNVTSLILSLYSIFAFIFMDVTFESKFIITLFSLIGSVVYYGTIYILHTFKIIDAFPYSFMQFSEEGKIVIQNIVTLSLFVLVPYALAASFVLFGNVASKNYVNSEKKAEKLFKEKQKAKKAKAKKVKANKKAQATKKAQASKKAVASKKVKIPKDISIDVPKDLDMNYKIYHVTKRSDANFWQVKYGKDVKCIKLFVEKEDALNYVKVLASITGASIRVHGENGKIEKI